MADWLQVRPRTIYQCVHEGYIPVIKLGSLVHFDPPGVADWINKRRVAGRTARRFETGIV